MGIEAVKQLRSAFACVTAVTMTWQDTLSAVQAASFSAWRHIPKSFGEKHADVAQMAETQAAFPQAERSPHSVAPSRVSDDDSTGFRPRTSSGEKSGGFGSGANE